jgi:hypothetical protein
MKILMIKSLHYDIYKKNDYTNRVTCDTSQIYNNIVCEYITTIYKRIDYLTSYTKE